MDFIDTAIFLKEKGIVEKLGIFGEEGGSLTTLSSMF